MALWLERGAAPPAHAALAPPLPLTYYTDLVTSALALAGKSAFVTGGARRIGRAIALALAQAGADVAISYHASQSEAAQTAADIASLGRRSLAIECDVRSESSVRTVVGEVAGTFGRLDMLVNNAAIFGSAALESLTLNQWDAVFETNARGPFLCGSRGSSASSAAAAASLIWVPSVGSELGPATLTTARQRLHCICSRKPWPRLLRPRSASIGSVWLD